MEEGSGGHFERHGMKEHEHDRMGSLQAAIERKRKSGQADQLRLCAVADVMTEVIKEKGLTPTPAAYFAALMAALEQQKGQLSDGHDAGPAPTSSATAGSIADVDTCAAMLLLLSMSLPLTPLSLRQAHGAAALRTLTPICSSALTIAAGSSASSSPTAAPTAAAAVARGTSGEAGAAAVAMARHGMVSMQLILEAVSAAGSKWGRVEEKAFALLLRAAIHPKPKLRRVSHTAAAAVLQSLQASPSLPAASQSLLSLVEETFVTALAPPASSLSNKASLLSLSEQTDDRSFATSASAALSLLHCLSLLPHTLPLLSPPIISRLLLRLLELLAIRHPLLSQRVLNVIRALLYSPSLHPPLPASHPSSPHPSPSPSSGVIPPTELLEVVKALLTHQPSLSSSSSAAAGAAHRSSSVAAKGSVDSALLICFASCLQKAVQLLVLAERDRGLELLPAALSAVIDLLGSGSDDVAYAAASCAADLINCCLDSTTVAAMLQVKRSNSWWQQLTAPLVRSLQLPFVAVWSLSLSIVTSLFKALGRASVGPMDGIVRLLADMEDTSDEQMTARPQLHAAVGAAIAAMGPAHVVSLIDLRLGSPSPPLATQPSSSSAAASELPLSAARLWLLPLIRQHTTGESLSFVSNTIMPLAALLRERSKKATAEGRPVAARNSDACLDAISGLLPAAVNFCSDTARCFPLIAKSWGEALSSEQSMRRPICQALQVLISQNRAAAGLPAIGLKRQSGGEEEEEEGEEERQGEAAGQQEVTGVTKQVAEENLKAIAAFSRNYLPILFNVYIATAAEKRAPIQSAISCFASISDPPTVRSFFTTVMQKLLETSAPSPSPSSAAESPNAKRATFLELASALLSGLDSDCIRLLIDTAVAAIKAEDASLQKRGYKVLALTCELRGDTTPSLSLLSLLLPLASSCSSAAKRNRLRCLKQLLLLGIQENFGQAFSLLPSFLPEVILATKESNSKTRDIAFSLLLSAAHEADKDPNGLFNFFSLLLAGLAASSPHMLSASVTAIARCLFEFGPSLLHAVPQLLPSAFLLLRSKNREVIKAVLGLLKVVAVRLPAESIDEHLKEMVEALLLWSDDSKNKFKAKVRSILERLVACCGFERVSEVLPEEHRKLLQHMRKQQRRERTKAHNEAASVSSRGSTALSRHSKWNHSAYFSRGSSFASRASSMGADDSDDGAGSRGRRGGADAARGKAEGRGRRGASQNILLPTDAEEGDDPLDLLGGQQGQLRQAEGSRGRQGMSRAAAEPTASRGEAGDGFSMAVDSDGKFVVTEERGNATKRSRNEEEAIPGGKVAPRASGAVGRGTVNGKKQKKDQGWAYAGQEYAAKGEKGGDVKRKGRLEPHAYWPLDPKMLNRREGKRSQAVRGMTSVLNKKKGKKVGARNKKA